MDNDRWQKNFKRVLDLLGAVTGLILLSPIFLLVAMLIWLDSPGKVFFAQTRLGKGGKTFQMFKFRTMRDDSEELLPEYLHKNPTERLCWEEFQKLLTDPRLTRIGRLLRRYSLDELPQLWNVLRGEMSLVGPRPCLPFQQRMYGEAFYQVFSVPPGMTGLWQVSGRNHLSFAERVQLDLEYVRRWSLWLDGKILLRTIVVVLRSDGAF